jgi:hypothetical protein
MTTYNWAIAQTNYNTDDKFIFCAHWTVSAVDGTYTASSYGTCGFAAGQPITGTKEDVVLAAPIKSAYEVQQQNLANQE